MPIPLRVLILEDRPADAQLILHELRQAGFDPEWQRVETEEEYLAALHPALDIILSDYKLPQFDGLSALRLLRARGLDIPFILISGTIGEDLAVECIKQGADDYLLKDRLTRLGSAVKSALEQKRLREERKLAEAALWETESQLRAVLNNAPITIFTTDSQGIFTLSEGKGLENVRLKPGENVGMSAFDLYGSFPFVEYSGKVTTGENVIRRVLAGEEVTAITELRSVYFDNHMGPLRGTDGKVVGIVGVAIDVTERKQMEISLAESEKNYRTLFENVPIGLYRTTSDGRMVDANPALVKMFGFQDREALLAMNADDLYADPADKAKFLQAIRQGDIVSNFETEMRQRDGTTFWASDNVRINRNDEGYVLSYEGSMVDVTERKQAEKRNETQLRRLAALHSIDIAIASSFDLRVTLNVVTKQALDQLGVDATSVLLLDPYLQTLQYAAGNGFRTRAIETASIHLGEGFAGRAALERQIIQVIDPVQAQENPRLAAFWTSEEFSAYCAVPIITKGKVKGVLEVFHRAPHALKSTDDEWLNFLETLAGQAAIAIDNAQLFDGMQRANMDLAVAYNATIEGWSQAMDLRDKETEGHTQRVTEMAGRLAQAMGISDTELVHIRRGALLHDIGKMGIPDGILLKPDKLTDEEWVIMKKHPQFAYDMLSSIAYLKPALDIPYCHHEKWDGTGYPRGLKGGQIPMAARLFAIVDVWDALRSDRPYRPAWSKEKTLAYIRELSGSHFDPDVVDVFLATIASTSKKES